MIKLSIVVVSAILSLSSIAAYAEQSHSQKNRIEAVKEQSISINTANVETLMLLKGIGKKTAQAIIDYRSANGDFKSVDELLNVKGVGAKVLSKIERFVTL
jgi:competence protein ComEA